ncbi:putative SWEET sugar transporter [Rosa chinensis]|uniref:Bidirectional sugar transporter SWEET n=2 Tax=Rosa chinensis TaxID=74649 RepID=A0A2P6SEI9_ROSCH|nr:putative SWEET sugar transporter [Rosa chinensis]
MLIKLCSPEKKNPKSRKKKNDTNSIISTSNKKSSKENPDKYRNSSKHFQTPILPIYSVASNLTFLGGDRLIEVNYLIFLLTMAISSITIFGVLGNIMSGLLYLSPTNVFVRIAKRRSTEEFESIPYISKLLNAYFWVYYGFIKPNSVVVATVNVFGAAVEIVFLTIFLLFAPPRMKVRTAILVIVLDVAFPGATILLTHFLLDGDKRIDVAGLWCVIFSMIAYASPLSAMKTVVALKSVEYMPFLLSFIFFLNGGVWTVYAILAKDLFVGIPNGSGFLLGTAQLILYFIYWKPKSSRQASDGLEDQQIISEALISNPSQGKSEH